MLPSYLLFAAAAPGRLRRRKQDTTIFRTQGTETERIKEGILRFSGPEMTLMQRSSSQEERREEKRGQKAEKSRVE